MTKMKKTPVILTCLLLLLLCLAARHLGIEKGSQSAKGEKCNGNHDGEPAGI